MKIKLINVVSYLFIFAVIIMVGMAMNFLVIQDNNGDMPVLTDNFIKSDKHFSFQDKSEVNYYYLSDIFRIKNLMISIGDIIMAFGIFGILFFYYQLMLNIKYERSKITSS